MFHPYSLLFDFEVMRKNHLNLIGLINNEFLIHLMKLDENNKMLNVVDQHLILDEQLMIDEEIY
jgi:hypothetical protein